MEHFNEFFIENIMWFIALGVVLGLLIAPILSNIKQLDPQQSVQKINNADALVLDIREFHEYEKGHIVNSIHIPLSQIKSKPDELKKHKTKPIIVVCQTGSRSAIAISTLKKSGYEDLYNLRGGIVAWSNEQLPLTIG